MRHIMVLFANHVLAFVVALHLDETASRSVRIETTLFRPVFMFGIETLDYSKL